MKFEELWNLVQEDIESGEKLASIFRDNKVGMGGPEFISFEYLTKDGKRAKYVLNIGSPYEEFSVQKANKAIEFEKSGDMEELKAKVRPKVEKIAQRFPEGQIPKYPVKLGFWTIDEIVNKGVPDAVSEIISARSRKEDAARQGIKSLSTKNFDPVEGTKGLYKNAETGEYYVEGRLRSEKVIDKGNRREKTGYSLERTVVDKIVEKLLNIPQWRSFQVDPTKIKSIKSRGEIIELDGQEQTVNVLDIDHDNAFKAVKLR